MKNSVIIAAIAGALLAIVASASLYVVDEREQVIITQFGEPVGEAVTEPGLHVKAPFIQRVLRFEKRWLEWDGDESEMPTDEKTYVFVDTYARWRIVDPLKFYTSVGNERGAQSRLDDIIDSETRNVVAAHKIIEVVRSSNRAFSSSEESSILRAGRDQPTVEQGREALAKMVLERASVAMPDFGIELVDVQFQRVNYTAKVEAEIFNRMTSERKRIAELYRSEGQGKRAEILGKKDRELKTISSSAYKQVQEIKGDADAKATAIYADAYNRDPELYKLVKSLETYEDALSEDSTMVLSTDSEFLKTLVDPNGK
ncbi:MAG: protease modulator HflC [Myxococcota bacterium]